jgi:hypothetical protein
MLSWPDALCERLAAGGRPTGPTARRWRRGNDPVAARATAARVWDRTPGTAPPVQMANQLGMGR